MSGKSFFIDTSLCMACKGCQVACKQWHDLPAEKTVNRGTYQNPADLSFVTYKLVRFNETVIDGKLKWLFFPDQCRHCLEPPCEMAAEDPGAIFRDPATGAVPTGPALTYEARCEGLIAEQPSGSNGFGYDPVFYYPPLNKTFGELTIEEKSHVSHRGKALRELRDEFDKVIIWIKQHMPVYEKFNCDDS